MLCTAHTVIVIALLIAGFMCLNVVLMNIGQKAVGVVGTTLLCFIPVWYGTVTWAERRGILEPQEEMMTDTVEQARETVGSKLS
jgi:spore maturation protein SpmA